VEAAAERVGGSRSVAHQIEAPVGIGARSTS
jgi:hypothetical protein